MSLPTYPYDLTNVTSATDPAKMFQVANQLTGGAFGLMTIVAVFILSFIISNRYGSKDAFITSSFLAFLAASFMSYVGIVDMVVVLMMICLMGIAVVIRRGNE